MKGLIERLEESYEWDDGPFLKYFEKHFPSVMRKEIWQTRFKFYGGVATPYNLFTDNNGVKIDLEIDFELTKKGWVVEVVSRWLARYDVPEELYGRDNDMVRYGEPEEEWDEDEATVSFKDPTSKSEMDKALKKIAKAVDYVETDTSNQSPWA